MKNHIKYINTRNKYSNISIYQDLLHNKHITMNLTAKYMIQPYLILISISGEAIKLLIMINFTEQNT